MLDKGNTSSHPIRCEVSTLERNPETLTEDACLSPRSPVGEGVTDAIRCELCEPMEELTLGETFEDTQDTMHIERLNGSENRCEKAF